MSVTLWTPDSLILYTFRQKHICVLKMEKCNSCEIKFPLHTNKGKKVQISQLMFQVVSDEN